jgi:hypothetical protein
MVDSVQEILDGMQDIRIRNAILITALRKIEGPLIVSRQDAHESAQFDVAITRTPGAFHVSLVPAPKAG